MEMSSWPLFDNVLDVIQTANRCLDPDLIRRKIFDIFLKSFEHRGALFFLPDVNGMFSNIMIHNLDEAFNRTFKNYYYKFDPLHLIEGSDDSAPAGLLTQRIAYDRILATEYYNDFLKPQKIHYKLIAYLETMEGVLGKIVLTRPAESASFSNQEAELARTICPYLAHALSLNDLRKKISLRDNILQFIENDLSTGILLIDESMRLVYVNQKARELCRKLCGYSGSTRDGGYIHPDVMEAFCKMIKSIRNQASRTEIIRPPRTIIGNNAVKLSACAKFLENAPKDDGYNYYMIYISELKNDLSIDQSNLRRMFELSKREMDVMAQIFKGLKNSEIARKLFISEITVKKHIQKIYAKVGVKNRISLMNKIMAM
jgi:DNA-binding CsgD family transcriptional regulator